MVSNCPVTGQGVMGTNWGTGSSVWTWGGTSSLLRVTEHWTGCPGRLWSLLLWRYSRPAWTRSCAACCRWPCFGGGVGLHDPQRSLPTPTILWFCDSVNCPLSVVGKASTVDPRMDTWTPVTCLVSLLGGHLAASLSRQHLVFHSWWASS